MSQTTATENPAEQAGCRADESRRWPLERVLFALAGHDDAAVVRCWPPLVSPWFLLLTAFVGVNQWLYVLVGACPASIVLRRVVPPAFGRSTREIGRGASAA